MLLRDQGGEEAESVNGFNFIPWINNLFIMESCTQPQTPAQKHTDPRKSISACLHIMEAGSGSACNARTYPNRRVLSLAKIKLMERPPGWMLESKEKSMVGPPAVSGTAENQELGVETAECKYYHQQKSGSSAGLLLGSSRNISGVVKMHVQTVVNLPWLSSSILNGQSSRSIKLSFVDISSQTIHVQCKGFCTTLHHQSNQSVSVIRSKISYNSSRTLLRDKEAVCLSQILACNCWIQPRTCLVRIRGRWLACAILCKENSVRDLQSGTGAMPLSDNRRIKTVQSISR
ncbi:hypothetical protein Tco_1292108 [Tanacetum coccineum]